LLICYFLVGLNAAVGTNGGRMGLYIISYDQHRDKDYTPVWTALRGWGAKRILESVWFVENAATAAQIRDSLRTQTRDEDSLLVLQIQPGSFWGSFKAQEEGVAWLKTHISQ
jgi:hypothetical protein